MSDEEKELVALLLDYYEETASRQPKNASERKLSETPDIHFYQLRNTIKPN